MNRFLSILKARLRRVCVTGSWANPIGYVDADMAGVLDGRKLTSGYIYTFAGGVVS